MATKKFDSVIEALNQINANTADTNQTIKDLILQDKKQEENRKIEETAADKGDKTEQNFDWLKKIGDGTGTNKVAGDVGSGILGSLGTAAGLAGLMLLMENFDSLKDAAENLAEKFEDLWNLIPEKEDLPQTATGTLGAAKAVTTVASKGIGALSRFTSGMTGADYKIPKPSIPVESEADRLKRVQNSRAQAASELIKTSPKRGIMTDIGELKLNEASGRYTDAGGKFVKTNDAVEAIARTAPEKMPQISVPEIDLPPRITTPDDSIIRRMAQGAGKVVDNTPIIGKALKVGKFAVKNAPVVGNAIDAGLGMYNYGGTLSEKTGSNVAGYGLGAAAGIGEGLLDLGDAGLNAITSVGGGLAGAYDWATGGEGGFWSGMKSGWENDIDMSSIVPDTILGNKQTGSLDQSNYVNTVDEFSGIEAPPIVADPVVMEKPNIVPTSEGSSLLQKLDNLIDALTNRNEAPAVTTVNNVSNGTTMIPPRPLSIDVPDFFAP